jgi:hypothetical protein
MKKFTHDCTDCQYLCSVTVETPKDETKLQFDLYLCKGAASSLGGTLLSRYGDEIHEYISIPYWLIEKHCACHYSLTVGYTVAKQQHLI